MHLLGSTFARVYPSPARWLWESRETVRSSSASSGPTSSSSVKASKTGWAKPHAAVFFSDAHLSLLTQTLKHPQRPENSDAFHGELREGALAERASGSALQAAVAAGAAHWITGHGAAARGGRSNAGGDVSFRSPNTFQTPRRATAQSA